MGKSNFQAQGIDPTQVNAALNQAGSAVQQQQALVNALSAQNGIGNQSQIYNQLQDVVSGQGPNPAQAMLNQATGANVANQAALMAGQRGSGANVGLLARQVGQQGAATEQQAVGQGATLQAQQALGALGQAGALADQQVAQQQGALSGLNQAALGTAGLLNQRDLNAQQLQEQVSEFNSSAFTRGLGALTGGLDSASTLFMHGKAEGGAIEGPSSITGKHLLKYAKGGHVKASAATVPTMVSPDEIYIPPSKVGAVIKGKLTADAAGERIPGKAKVPGDSEANDTVKKNLQVGGVVIPRTKANDDKLAKARFVAAAIGRPKRGK